MTQFVLDASVAAKWLLPGASEPLRAEALALLRDCVRQDAQANVPCLFWPEMANLLRKAVRRRRTSPQAAQAGLDELQSLGLNTVHAPDEADHALELSLRFGCSAYDMTYVALALDLGVEFVTADAGLVQAAGIHLPVRWLGRA